MSKKDDQRIGQCVYCGCLDTLTDDHVPPRNIFPKPRPSNLITVPSCITCNKSADKDDEYFRLALIMWEEVFAHPETKGILPSVQRSLLNPNKVGFRRDLIKRLRDVDVISSEGEFLKKGTVYTVDLHRLERVAERITRGLFWHETKSRIPDRYQVIAFGEPTLKAAVNESGSNSVIQDDLESLLSIPARIIGRGVFSYRMGYVDDDPYMSAWLLTFYEHVFFLCYVMHNAELP